MKRTKRIILRLKIILKIFEFFMLPSVSVFQCIFPSCVHKYIYISALIYLMSRPPHQPQTAISDSEIQIHSHRNHQSLYESRDSTCWCVCSPSVKQVWVIQYQSNMVQGRQTVMLNKALTFINHQLTDLQSGCFIWYLFVVSTEHVEMKSRTESALCQCLVFVNFV